MGRTFSARPRRREGRGLGEILSESMVFIMLGVGLVAAGYWYFAIYRKSPQVALEGFVAAINSGNVEAQYSYLADSTRQQFGSESNYKSKFPLAFGLSARIASFSVSNAVQSGDNWSADVRMNVREPSESLLNAPMQSYTDHYVLTKQSDGWRVVLEKSKVDTSKARTPSSYGMAPGLLAGARA